LTGPTGPTGATGANPFVSVGGAVTFNYTLGLTLLVNITPFVETPDGQTFMGTPFGLLTLSSSVIVPAGSAVFGTYHYGVLVGSTLLGVSTALNTTVTVGGRSPTSYSLSTTSISVLANQTQITNEFTLGPVGTLPN
jgi:hypothetical protein